MQLLWRYLPIAIIIIALAVIVWIVLRKLPKTAQLEAELKEQKSDDKPGKSGEVGADKPRGKVGRAAKKVTEKFGVVGSKIGAAFKSERFGKVLALVKRKKASLATPEGAATKEKEPATSDSEKQKIAAQLLREAEDFARQANWQAAEKVYIKAVALLPKSVEAYLGLGKLYMRQKNWDDAAASYREALKYDDANITAWGDLGLALANKSEWVASVEALERAAKLDPGNAERQASLGMAYMTIKEPKKSIRAYREAIKHDRDNLSHKIELARAAKADNDPALAEETLKEVLAKEPLNEQAKELLKELQDKKELE